MLKVTIDYNYSDFQIVHAPYAIAAYAASLANGPAISITNPTPISTAPSNEVRSSSLFLIHALTISSLPVSNIY